MLYLLAQLLLRLLQCLNKAMSLMLYLLAQFLLRRKIGLTFRLN